MDKNHIATKQDIEDIKLLCYKLIESVQKIKNDDVRVQSKFVRTKQAKELLQVSTNKLKTMRERGEIKWSYIGSIYYYDWESISNLLNENSVDNSKF